MVQKAASTVRDFTQNHNEQRQLITTKDKRQLRLLRIKAIGNTTPLFLTYRSLMTKSSSEGGKTQKALILSDEGI